MTNEEALEVLEKWIVCMQSACQHRTPACSRCKYNVDVETVFAAVKVAAGVMRRVVEGKSPCADCGYGGKHLDAPPCTECPVYPKGV